MSFQTIHNWWFPSKVWRLNVPTLRSNLHSFHIGTLRCHLTDDLRISETTISSVSDQLLYAEVTVQYVLWGSNCRKVKSTLRLVKGDDNDKT